MVLVEFSYRILSKQLKAKERKVDNKETKIKKVRLPLHIVSKTCQALSCVLASLVNLA